MLAPGRGLRRAGREEAPGLLSSPAETSPQLVELGEPEVVRPLDPEDGEARDIEPDLDDARGDENRRLSPAEREHPPELLRGGEATVKLSDRESPEGARPEPLDEGDHGGGRIPGRAAITIRGADAAPAAVAAAAAPVPAPVAAPVVAGVVGLLQFFFSFHRPLWELCSIPNPRWGHQGLRKSNRCLLWVFPVFLISHSLGPSVPQSGALREVEFDSQSGEIERCQLR